MISCPIDCAVLSKKYPASYTAYTVTRITVNLGAKSPCYVLTECPVEADALRRHQRDLTRIGLNLSDVDILNWALLAGSCLDLQPIASTLTRLSLVTMAEFIPVVIHALSDLGSLLQPLFRGYGLVYHVVDYSDGFMVVEVKNVIDPRKAINCTT